MEAQGGQEGEADGPGERGCEELEHMSGLLGSGLLCTGVTPSTPERTVGWLGSVSPACRNLESRACGQMRDVDLGELASEDPPLISAEARADRCGPL